MIKKILIEVIPHTSQRYNTVGDWRFFQGETPCDGTEADSLSIKISESDSDQTTFLLAIHELVEAVLCKVHGVEQRRVDEFDLSWTPHRHWSGIEISEPGDDPMAPYAAEHLTASGIERLLAERMYLDWIRYENEVEMISNSWPEVEEPVEPVEPAPPSIDTDTWDDDIPF